MTRFETPRVAVLGASETARGWSALAVAAGWPVSIYDPDADLLARAVEAIGDRVVTLVRLKRAEATIAQEALNQLRVGRSLLQTVSDANWVIEAVTEDLSTKLNMLTQAEQVSRQAAIMTSSASGFGPTMLGGRLERPERFMVAHPIDPVELIPLVEVVPGPRTDPECIEDVRLWLGLLGRAPVVFKKEISGNISARLGAALWRECIQMVVDGVLDVEDVDRAVSVGPALAWIATGPHLSHQLSSGDWGPDVYLARMLGQYEAIWKDLADWKQIGPEDQKKFIKLVERAYANHGPELAAARTQRLVRLLEALRE